MSMKWLGSTLQQTKIEYGYDPQSGPYREEEWTGSPNAIGTLVGQVRQQGLAVRETQDGPLKTCTIRFTNWADAEEARYTEVWTHTTEVIEKEIWAQPYVADEMERSGNPANYKKIIEEALSEGKTTTELGAMLVAANIVITDSSEWESVYFELCRGADHYTTEANVVRRIRTAGLTWAFNRVIMSTKYIYPPGKILGIPTDVWSYYTDNESYPPEEPLATVGWRIRSQEYEVSGDRRTETIEIVLAAWSETFYKVYTGQPFYL